MEQQMQLGFGDWRPCYSAGDEAEATHPAAAAPDVDELIEAGAIFYCSVTVGGKTRRRCMPLLRERIPHALSSS